MLLTQASLWRFSFRLLSKIHTNVFVYFKKVRHPSNRAPAGIPRVTHNYSMLYNTHCMKQKIICICVYGIYTYMPENKGPNNWTGSREKKRCIPAIENPAPCFTGKGQGRYCRCVRVCACSRDISEALGWGGTLFNTGGACPAVRRKPGQKWLFSGFWAPNALAESGCGRRKFGVWDPHYFPQKKRGKLW